jgi:Predicted eukaryotic-type DNA primase
VGQKGLEALGMQSFAKTSGSKGLQVYVPLNTPTTYEKTKTLALTLAQLLERKFPKTIVSKMQRSLRSGKVFVDWSQNDDHKTTVNAYSLRAKSRPTVSTPLLWDEVAETVNRGDSKALAFDFNDVLARVDKMGDLFAPSWNLSRNYLARAL